MRYKEEGYLWAQRTLGERQPEILEGKSTSPYQSIPRHQKSRSPTVIHHPLAHQHTPLRPPSTQQVSAVRAMPGFSGFSMKTTPRDQRPHVPQPHLPQPHLPRRRGTNEPIQRQVPNANTPVQILQPRTQDRKSPSRRPSSCPPPSRDRQDPNPRAPRPTIPHILLCSDPLGHHRPPDSTPPTPPPTRRSAHPPQRRATRPRGPRRWPEPPSRGPCMDRTGQDLSALLCCGSPCAVASRPGRLPSSPAWPMAGASAGPIDGARAGSMPTPPPPTI